MSEWKTIAELADTNPETLPANSERDFAFQYIDLGSVDSGTVDWKGLQHLSFQKAPSRARRRCRPGDSIFGTVRPNLQSHGYVPSKKKELLVASTGFTVIRPHRGLADGRYLFFSLLGDDILRQSVNAAVGSNYPAVTDRDVREFRLFAPPVDQQSKIADVLEALDTQIQKTEALITKLEKVKEGLLHDLLTRGIDENGQLRPRPEQAPELYKESSLRLIPREWDTSKISDLSTKVTNGFVGVATPHYTESLSGVIYLFGNNIRKNRIDFRRHERVTQAFHKAQVKSQLKNGDMLTVQSGHIGTSAVYESSAGKANCHALIITRFIPSQVNSRFASLYLNSTLGMLAQGRIFVGSTILHINTSDLAKLIIPTPTLSEQERIVDHFFKIEDQLQVETRHRDSLAKLKIGLMDDLLTGRVRVTPLLDQAQTTTPA